MPPPHTAENTLYTLEDVGIQIVKHPTYSTNLLPCNFYIFPKLKERLRGAHIENEWALEVAVQRALRDMAFVFEHMDLCLNTRCIAGKSVFHFMGTM